MVDLLWFLLLGHFLGDFAFQTDKMAANKKASNKTLTLHVAVYTMTVAGCLWLGLYLTGSARFVSAATAIVMATIFVEHWLQDHLKGSQLASKQSFYLDQALHIVILFFIRVTVY
ncbi:MAG: DUF3307 domain-containing protein [bacterium]